MWHKVAPPLAERFTVVVPDVRGYGDNDKPPAPTRSTNSSIESAKPKLGKSLVGGVLLGEFDPALVHAVPDYDEADPPNVEGKVVNQEQSLDAEVGSTHCE